MLMLGDPAEGGPNGQAAQAAQVAAGKWLLTSEIASAEGGGQGADQSLSWKQSAGEFDAWWVVSDDGNTRLEGLLFKEGDQHNRYCNDYLVRFPHST